ncbi:NYN domain-containing protein [Prosthecochloris sp. N3]|uniref:NYN domain-containing protein n=1 Tax=Prosthecochloris ethylica TaxID=2743976 RepID=A0ABR9XQQ4_9CHLB|nr:MULTISPECIES: NYN domain-containing protein [Prosthecochloris]MBF0586560.1 NYN domain-containing protein [Prosthecochloris ethylica]MBF0636173.1 NYN domain-containing protein [Prosthecochloris ethylica]NUK47692.1 NYN domain-containing protein [Prosthecochloris ethylica]RNA64358.1 NYN domain-containing protein [Prosthecochloris sp. ZM_2]
MTQSTSRKAGLFIDGANLFYTQRHQGWQIDFVRLMAYFMQSFDSVEARYYVPEAEDASGDQAGFYRMLQANGYTVISKPVKKIVNHETGELVMKGNLDVELVVDALMMAGGYDVFVLFSGDSDFLPLMRALRSMGRGVRVYSTRGVSARELISEPGIVFEDLDAIRSRIEQSVVQGSPAERRSPDTAQSPVQRQLPEKGTMFTGSVLAVKPYGVFLSNPYQAKCLLPLSFLGVATRIDSLPSIVRSTDIFRVSVFSVETAEETPKITVKLVDRQLSAELEERVRRYNRSRLRSR